MLCSKTYGVPNLIIIVSGSKQVEVQNLQTPLQAQVVSQKESQRPCQSLTLKSKINLGNYSGFCFEIFLGLESESSSSIGQLSKS